MLHYCASVGSLLAFVLVVLSPQCPSRHLPYSAAPQSVSQSVAHNRHGERAFAAPPPVPRASLGLGGTPMPPSSPLVSPHLPPTHSIPFHSVPFFDRVFPHPTVLFHSPRKVGQSVRSDQCVRVGARCERICFFTSPVD